jgi:uncharacterized protein (TIGR02265 family)
VFVEPLWDAAFVPEAVIRAIPDSAQVRGLMIAPMIAEMKKRRWPVKPPRERYVSFNLYPLREHARVLIDTCQNQFPDKPLRDALRRLGRAGPSAFAASTVGKVTLGAAEGIHDIVNAFAKGYELTMLPGSATILESHPRRIVVRLEQVHHFLDSHHVGAFEGAMTRAGVRGKVSIFTRSSGCADLLLQW